MTHLRVGDRVELRSTEFDPILPSGSEGIVNELYPARVTMPGTPTLHDSRNDFVASVVFYGLQRSRPAIYGDKPVEGLNTGINMPVSEAFPVRDAEVVVTGNILLEGAGA